MKIQYAILAGALLFASCGEDKGNKKSTAQETFKEPDLHTHLYGTYVGEMSSYSTEDEGFDEQYELTRISININHITSKGVNATSVVNGKTKSLTGQLVVSGQDYSFTLEEPGKSKDDGRYEFNIYDDNIIGIWISYTDKSNKGKRKIELSKKPFKYNPNAMLSNDWSYIDWEKAKETKSVFDDGEGGTYSVTQEMYRTASEAVFTLNASSDLLTEGQLKNLTKLDLEIIRNTIFARHGYAFKKKAVRQFFDYVDWYVPVSENVDAQLTAIEKENIALLKRFEEHAEDNYEYFGR